MTRVFHLITRFRRGGAETTTRHTLEALAAADEEYHLALGTGASYNADQLRALEDAGVETTVFRSIRHYNPLAAAVAVPAVASYLRRTDVEVLHTHSTEAGVIGRLAATLAGTPTVIHEVHGDPITPDRPATLNRFLLAVERLSARFADRIVVKAERIREIYLDREIGSPEQYEVIHHGVDTARFQDAPGASAGPTDGPVRLLFVGRLTDGKGLFDLLNALDRVATERDVRLWIVGDGDLDDALGDEIARRSLPAELLGYREDVPELMASSDVLVLPSYREGTPRVITEAMASGLPVIATDVGGVADQVADGDSGFLVEPGDVDALANRIATLVDEPERRARFGEAGRGRAERYGWDHVSDEIRSFYRDLLETTDRRERTT